jgi:hypothetical protein
LFGEVAKEGCLPIGCWAVAQLDDVCERAWVDGFGKSGDFLDAGVCEVVAKA